MIYVLFAIICLVCSLINVPSALQGDALSIFAMIFCFLGFIFQVFMFARSWWD